MYQQNMPTKKYHASLKSKEVLIHALTLYSQKKTSVWFYLLEGLAVNESRK